MKLQNIIFYTVLVWFVMGNISAQNLKNDLQMMREQYKNITNFHAKITTSSRDLQNTTAPLLKETTEIYKQGNNYLYTIGTKTMLINEKCVLMIDSKHKIAVYQKKPKESQTLQSLIAPQIDSLLKSYGKVEYKETNGIRKYTIYNLKSYMYKMELYINANTWFIDKLVYQYKNATINQNSEITISFKDITTTPSFTEDFFSEKKYLLVQAKEIKLTPAYKSYRLTVIPSE